MNELCYACLLATPDTSDHVPPRSFFPPPRPSNLITVPCCFSCNNGNSKEDDYARFILTSLLDRSAAGDAIWENKVVRGYFPRNPREIDAISPSLKDVIIERNGKAVEATSFSIDHGRLSRYFIRMTKALLRHHYPSYDYAKATFDTRFVLLEDKRLDKLAEVRDMLHYHHVGEGVFQYRHGLTDTGLSGVWMLVFYEAILVLVHHAKQKD